MRHILDRLRRLAILADSVQDLRRIGISQSDWRAYLSELMIGTGIMFHWWDDINRQVAIGCRIDEYTKERYTNMKRMNDIGIMVTAYERSTETYTERGHRQ